MTESELEFFHNGVPNHHRLPTYDITYAHDYGHVSDEEDCPNNIPTPLVRSYPIHEGAVAVPNLICPLCNRSYREVSRQVNPRV